MPQDIRRATQVYIPSMNWAIVWRTNPSWLIHGLFLAYPVSLEDPARAGTQSRASLPCRPWI